MYIYVVVASESLEATSGGEDSQSVCTTQVYEMCEDEENIPCRTIYTAETRVPVKW